MKRPTQLLEEDRAVSPVVGVALLIAIAVILAAVVGAVVLGLGTSGAEAPQASLSFENASGDLVVNHDGGDPLVEDEIVIRGAVNDTSPWTELTAGESATFSSANLTDGSEVSVVWQDPESDEETILGSETF